MPRPAQDEGTGGPCSTRSLAPCFVAAQSAFVPVSCGTTRAYRPRKTEHSLWLAMPTGRRRPSLSRAPAVYWGFCQPRILRSED